VGRIALVGVNGFDFFSPSNELRELFTMPPVKVLFDVMGPRHRVEHKGVGHDVLLQSIGRQ